jgi:uncharacterized membrane protein HdeD (DUF308 family)
VADDPKKIDPAPPPATPSTPDALRVILFVFGVIAILIGVALWRHDSVGYNRYGTPTSSRFPGLFLIMAGVFSIISAFRRDPGKRFP